MEIIGNKIHMVLTEEEADVLLQSLCQYQGPYGSNLQGLTERELDRHRYRLELSVKMQMALADELMRRHHEAEEIKFYQGRG